jgi:endonuclease/exonuclease/phosphatase (EEP) superfamily protein YafD
MPTFETVYLTVRVILLLASTLTGVCTVLGYLGRYWWFFELFSHFQVQYLFIQLAVVILALALKTWVVVGIGSILAGINLIKILPLYNRVNRRAADQHVFRIFFANVLQKNTAYSRVHGLIQKYNPDFVILVETNREWIEGMNALSATYPYRINVDREDNYGLSIFSRNPAVDADIVYFGDAGVPSIVARYEQYGEHLRIICTHPPPPKGRSNSLFRNKHLSDIARFVRTLDSEVCLCGDINMTPWSPFFGDLLRESGLVNSAIGYGVQPTWPVRMPLLRVPIDHCLVSSEIQTVLRTVGTAIGSDHFPLILDLSFQDHK